MMNQMPTNMQNMQQNQVYNEPPQIISVKDQLYLTDMMSWNLIAMKKAHFFASQCQIPEIKAELEKVGKMHHRHYQQILNQLNGNPQMQ